jgi:hypothetical protein
LSKLLSGWMFERSVKQDFWCSIILTLSFLFVCPMYWWFGSWVHGTE